MRALDGAQPSRSPKGEAFGLIGPNGAGKTTALKIATRITYPTSGHVRVRGRVGALIEVGTGMHPELTGRENVSLYGRILGLSSADIARRFDEIVEFAGIGAAIDQPVKQFSSGMQLRLGFSVAAHLEPDVLLVDEAIAVGDAGFQYRCVERMGELVAGGPDARLRLARHERRRDAVRPGGILLKGGRIAADGAAPDVVQQYLEGVQRALVQEDRTDSKNEVAAGALRIVRNAARSGRKGGRRSSMGNPLAVRMHFDAQVPVASPIFEVGISDGRIGCFALASMLIDGQAPEHVHGRGYVECRFESLPLLPRAYEIWGCIGGQEGIGDHVAWQRLRRFRVVGEIGGRRGAVTHGLVHAAPVVLPYSWQVVSRGGSDR